ncbi:hypothetical protein [Pseudoalteromonas luteoviolacea]|nr:hypothetical protein [Pseudoalteromonas luteoviolacea]KZN38203.1 hypothetical protein N483_19810 [Pseudoalteromonas luteoviolacea NCIMB 1944]
MQNNLTIHCKTQNPNSLFGSNSLKYLLPLLLLNSSLAWSQVETLNKPPHWDRLKAAQWLDNRAQWWLDYPVQQTPTDHNGAVQCNACHTTHTYTLVRPKLMQGTGLNERIFDNIRRRLVAGPGVAPWFVNPPGRLTQSRGSEAINTTYLLAMKEAREGALQPSPLLITAFERLWLHQRADGGWDWFNFTYEPLASIEAQHFAACQVAVAIGTAPGYFNENAPQALINRVDKLRNWLKASRNPNNLFGEAWLLFASTKLEGLLTPQEQNQIIGKLLQKQNRDEVNKGSWILYELNDWRYSEKTAPTKPRKLHPDARKPEAYSTGLIAYILMQPVLKVTIQISYPPLIGCVTINNLTALGEHTLSVLTEAKTILPIYFYLMKQPLGRHSHCSRGKGVEMIANMV